MSVRDTIEDKLKARFEPTLLEVIDESDRHHGHQGWREGGNTHFRIRIASRFFAGMSRVSQHRAVNETLGAELAGGVHALAIEIKPV